MSNNDGIDPAVKKRSLSSYLSNVTSRREELTKLKHEEEEEAQRKLLQEKKHKLEEERRLHQEREEIKENELRANKELEQQAVEEPFQSSTTKPTTASNSVATLHEAQVIEQAQDRESAARENETLDFHGKKNTSENTENGSQASAHSEPLIKAELYLELGNSGKREEGVTNANQCDEIIMQKIKSDDNNDSADEKTSYNRRNHDDEEEVDSDAPTEPASPPRPRRGRLIRGDRLASLSPRSTVFDNDSDSELSDIDELKTVQLSSSILHGDSSPTRPVQSSYKDGQHPSSPRSVRKQSPKKLKSHIAISKTPKQKKGIYRDAGGRTRLQIACDKGNYELARKLLQEENYDVNDQDNAGNTALHEAALNGHLDLVMLLTENGADVNIQSYEMFKDTPLIDASANGHLEVVKFLLNHGADPTIVNAKGLTAFESIEEDLDLDEQEREIVTQVRNCLRAASRKWKSNELLKRRVPESDDKPREKQLSLQKKSPEELLGEYEFFWTDITSRSGREKLFKASKEGKLAYVGAYLENGGRVDVKSFFEAVKFGHEDITSLFLAFGAKVNVNLKDGTTALMASVGRGHIGTVKLLLDAGADLAKKDKQGHTALFYAQNSITGVIDNEEIKLLKDSMRKCKCDGEIDEQHESEGKRVEEKEVAIENDQVNRSLDQGQVVVEADEAAEEEHFDDTKLDEEDMRNVGRKRRTMSPLRLESKRRTLTPNSSAGEDTENNEASATITEPPKGEQSATSSSVKIREETAEEKEQRLKAEEEYVQKRLQNKKKKEQELLRKLAQDAEKREQERSKQKLEEAKRIEAEKKQKQVDLLKKKEEVEIARRKEIRTMYPLGLKLIDFRVTDDYTNFLPLYFINKTNDDGTFRYVLDLQICVILKDTRVFSEEGLIGERIKVSPSHKKQLWNVLKFILLCGGNPDSKMDFRYMVDLNANDLNTRIKLDASEYQKFLQLPINWVKWDNIQFGDAVKKERIEQQMRELALIEKSPQIKLGSTSPATSFGAAIATDVAKPISLPTKLQHRRSLSWLSDPTVAGPMW